MLKKHQFGQIHFSYKTNIANYSWCTASKTSLIQQSGGPKPAEMVPPTDMEKQQGATEARKHVQDIKKKHNKKIYFADLYWFNKWSFSSVSRCVCTMVDVDYLSAGMLLDFSLDLSSDDEKRKQTKFHLLKMKQINR